MAAADSGSDTHTRRGWKRALSGAFCALVVGPLLSGAEVPREEAAAASDPAALLRQARASLDAGEPAASIALFERLAREHPIVGDYADSLRAEALEQAGDPALAVAAILGALDAYPRSRLRAALFQKLGDMRLSYADEGGARSAWAKAYEATRDANLRAELRYRVAQSNEREEKWAAAYEMYNEIWSEHPTHAHAVAAERRLAELEAKGIAEPRSARDWQRRGDQLFRAHLNEGALASYDKALELGLSKSSKSRARSQRAHALFLMRRYPEAVEAFAALPRDATQRLWHARSLARSDRVPESIDELEKLASEGHGEIGLRSTYLAGLLLDGRNFSERARKNFEQVAASRSYPGLAHGALWRLAWREYLDGDCAAALPRLERLVEIEKDALAVLRYRYWRARCLEKLDQPGGAGEFESMAVQYPFTYYGWRSSFRIPASLAGASVPPSRARPASGERRLSEDALLRPRILLAAGYAELARDELRALRSSGDRLGNADRLELAQLMSDAGDFYSAYLVAQARGSGQLDAGPIPGAEEMWWYAWPHAYQAEVDQALRQPGAAGRELVYGIMREESAYRPTVLSPVGAYGLMQIMPKTGEVLAHDIGQVGFKTDDLLRPDVNVRLGAHYLGQLSARFSGQLSAAIASYNAGPNAVKEWIERYPARDDDEWVEAIPYDETRRYVKAVLRSVHAYRVLY